MKKKPEQVKVLLSRDFPATALTLLRQEGFFVDVWDQERPMTPVELVERAKKVNALLCGGTDNIDADFLKHCNQLEIISQFAVGYDNVNVQEASRLGIPVCNTPNAMSDATADVAFGLMITASRKMFYMHKMIERGEWSYFRPKGFLGIELKNKTLGIFGMGRIGLEMAKRCRGAYNMKIIYHNRNANPQADQQLGATLVTLDELLKQSDVLSVHSVFSPETKGIFNRAAFSKMKPSSIFINTSRGGLHNEEDLIEALQNKTIWGAGLDVTNPEPMLRDNPLLSMENVSILPHIGSATIEARTEMARMAAQNIIEFYRGDKLSHNVNPEYDKTR
ncbi:D-glycerate dehydrogenase [soil metagenome]